MSRPQVIAHALLLAANFVLTGFDVDGSRIARPINIKTDSTQPHLGSDIKSG